VLLRVYVDDDGSWVQHEAASYRLDGGCLLVFKQEGRATQRDDGQATEVVYGPIGWRKFEIVTP
jgi:hypothetical protein